MAQLVEGGYQWQSEEHAEAWLSSLGEREAERARAFSAIIDLMRWPETQSLTFLDLGAGAGALSATLLERFPRATGLLADFSQPMTSAGSQALANYEGRYWYVDWDMNRPEWPAALAGPFDAAVSSQAIHHLRNERKALLFRQVFEHLTPKGIFANWDSLRDLQQAVDPHDLHTRTLATMDESLAMLLDAGFVDVRAVAMGEGSGLVSGRKPES